MRITGGRAKGIPLKIPAGNTVTRPATDRMRESVFSSLSSDVEDVRFLDLFAGTGAYGLEAWSRGASSGIFVEKDRKMAAVLKANLSAVAKSLGKPERDCQVLSFDALKFASDESFDLIFADPPYSMLGTCVDRLFKQAERLLADEGRFLLEMPGGFECSYTGWKLMKSLGKGKGQPVVGVFVRD